MDIFFCWSNFFYLFIDIVKKNLSSRDVKYVKYSCNTKNNYVKIMVTPFTMTKSTINKINRKLGQRNVSVIN